MSHPSEAQRKAQATMRHLAAMQGGHHAVQVRRVVRTAPKATSKKKQQQQQQKKLGAAPKAQLVPKPLPVQQHATSKKRPSSPAPARVHTGASAASVSQKPASAHGAPAKASRQPKLDGFDLFLAFGNMFGILGGHDAERSWFSAAFSQQPAHAQERLQAEAIKFGFADERRGWLNLPAVNLFAREYILSHPSSLADFQKRWRSLSQSHREEFADRAVELHDIRQA